MVLLLTLSLERKLIKTLLGFTGLSGFLHLMLSPLSLEIKLTKTPCLGPTGLSGSLYLKLFPKGEFRITPFVGPNFLSFFISSCQFKICQSYNLTYQLVLLSIFEKYINIPNTSLFFLKIQLWGRAQGAQGTPGTPGALVRIIFHREAKILYEVMLKK